MKRNRRTTCCGLALAGLAMAAGAQSASAQPPSPALEAAAIAALGEALADERHAHAIYQAAIARFGPVRPFVNIVEAEQRHIDALLSLYQHYGVAIPVEGAAVEPTSLPSTLGELCRLSAEAEIANVALYDQRLLPAVSAFPDIVAVMTSLRDASRDRHLPAFRRCGSRR